MAISAIAWLGISITLMIAAIPMVGVAWPAVAAVAAIPMTISMTIADPRHGVASMTIAVTTISMTMAMTITDSAVAVAWISIGQSLGQKCRNGDEKFNFCNVMSTL